MLLEGGYDLAALAVSVRASVEVLAGRSESFPDGVGPDAARAITATHAALARAGRSLAV